MGKVQNSDRVRRVVFYGRVSTEHEKQILALSNQMEWYDDQLAQHNNWILAGKYIDEGITGTQAKKRPSFLKMLEDARKGVFDLIVTREVCRFARNTVDTLVYTRELRRLGVEVYFIVDNIWTMDGDGELRLALMATLAQEESRKISERVREGQYTSRQNGVVYGNGNILGYDRRGKTYVINPEQAETVRLIYDLYLNGYGTKKIMNELIIRKRKDTNENVAWGVSKINRILRNCTYTGVQGYKKSEVNDFLEQKRINNHNESTYEYCEADYEAIISKEDFDTVQKIRISRRCVLESEGRFGTSENRTVGRKMTDDVWLKKLRCSCGSTFRKNKWRTNKSTGEDVFGYQCYNQVNNGSKGFREKNGLDTVGYCDIPMVADWKLDCMATYLIDRAWGNKKEAVINAYEMVLNCYTEENEDNKEKLLCIDKEIKALNKKKSNYIEMRAEGELSKAEFIRAKEKIDVRLSALEKQQEESQNCTTSISDKKSVMSAVQQELNKLVDFSGGKVDRGIVDRFVDRITPSEENKKFDWTLSFVGGYNESITCSVQGRKGKSQLYIMDNGEFSPIKVPCSTGSS